jgi:hypothetical protein
MTIFAKITFMFPSGTVAGRGETGRFPHAMRLLLPPQAVYRTFHIIGI